MNPFARFGWGLIVLGLVAGIAGCKDNPPPNQPNSAAAVAATPPAGAAADPKQTSPASTGFDPTKYESAVPAGGLPEKLAAAKQRELVAMVVAIEKKAGEYQKVMEQYNGLRQHVTMCCFDELWERVVAGNFKDQALPLDWYDATSGGSSLSFLADVAQMGAEMGALFAMTIPLAEVKSRLIGGAGNSFDAAYINSLDAWISARKDATTKAIPRLQKLMERLAAEGLAR